MGIRVLIADEDLNLQKTLQDVLETLHPDAKVERAIGDVAFAKKLRSPRHKFDIVFYDLHFNARSGKSALRDMLSEKPELARRAIVMAESREEIDAVDWARGLASMLKPFSIDDISDLVKKVCAA